MKTIETQLTADALHEKTTLLKRQLDKPMKADERIDTLNALAWELRFADSKESLRYAQQAYQLCELEFEINPNSGTRYQIAIARSLLIMGVCRWQLSDYHTAIDELLEALRLYNVIRETDLSNEYPEALEGIADTLNTIGNIHINLGDYPKALDYYQNALKIFEQLSDREGLSTSFNNIGLVHFKLGDYKKALDYYEQSLRYRQSISDVYAEVITLNNIGEVYCVMKDYEKALSYFNRSLKLHKESGSKHRTAVPMNHIGMLYFAMGDYEKALAYLGESLSIESEYGNRYSEAEALIALGSVYVKMGDFKNAFNHLSSALKIGEAISAKPIICNAHKTLSEIYKHQGDFDRALWHFEKFHYTKEGILGDEQSKLLRSLQVIQETEQARKEAELQRIKNIALAAANEEKSRLLEKLQEQARILEFQAKNDILTGLSNRRSYDERAAQEYERNRRHKHGFAVAIVDVDLFKKVNDTFSHQIGDEVLKRVAILMQMNCRKEDIVARYGGEEFVFLFPETTTEKAVIACEKVRVAIEKFDWSQIHPDLKITISVGVCGDTSQPSFEKMLSIADQHLYRAKQNGRNQVCY